MADEIHTYAGDKVTDSVDSASSELEQLINESTAAFSGEIGPPKIQSVPNFLRDEEKLVRNYEPKWIAIGPIHHGNPKLQLAERYKLKLTEDFIKTWRIDSNQNFIKTGRIDSNQNFIKISLNYLFSEIMKNIEDLKGHFDEEVIKDCENKTLARMLLVDGCFILQFIYSFFPLRKDPFLKMDQAAFVLNDLFLLENQIPFEVLELLMKQLESDDKKKIENSIQFFLRGNVMAPPKYQQKLDFDMNTLRQPAPAHLLDLLRRALLHQSNPKKVDCNFKLKDKFTSSSSLLPVTNEAQNQNQSQPTNNQCNDEEQQYFRSVTDLMAAGISLKPSKSCNLSETIKFYSGFFAAELELPPLVIDDSTEPKFLNLIAYEMCPDNIKTNYEITSYVAFLDSIIDYPNDVKRLRSAKILHNFLGCDEDVAKVFNRIGTLLVPNPDSYKTVIKQIEIHYRKKYMTWIAQVINDHFSSPWTILAFLAAVLVVALTIIQTWYTIYPSGP